MELATQESLTTLEMRRLSQRLRYPPFNANAQEAAGVLSLIGEASSEFISFLYKPDEYSKSAINYLGHLLEEFRGNNVGNGYAGKVVDVACIDNYFEMRRYGYSIEGQTPIPEAEFFKKYERAEEPNAT